MGIFYARIGCQATENQGFRTAWGGWSYSLLAKSVLPISFDLWWYPTTYVVFLMIWPFYHKALMRFEIGELKKCILVMFAIWSLTTLIPYTAYGANALTSFMTLYAVTLYVRRKEIVFQKKKKLFIGMMVLPYLFAIITIIALDLLGTRIAAAAEYSCYYMRGDFRPVSMLVSMGLFMWATSWKVKASKVINFIAAGTFGIYLIHMYPTVMYFLFTKVFTLSEVIYEPTAVPYLIVVTLLIFTVGMCIDSLRRGLFSITGQIIGKIRR